MSRHAFTIPVITIPYRNNCFITVNLHHWLRTYPSLAHSGTLSGPCFVAALATLLSTMDSVYTSDPLRYARGIQVDADNWTTGINC